MITGCANFKATGNQLIVATTCSGRASPRLDTGIPLPMALAATMGMERAVFAALAQGGDFPHHQANILVQQYGWHDGYHLLLQQQPEIYKFIFNAPSIPLVPELVPVQVNGRDTWLDTLGPTYRTLEDIGQPPVRHPEELLLAIVVQLSRDPLDFYEFALALQAHLNTQGLTVQIFTIPDFHPPERLYQKLNEIFFHHRAVLFLGHLAEKGREGWGWQLGTTDDTILTMNHLNTFLTGGRRRGPVLLGEQPAPSIPELVFANCCRSAAGERGLHYPELFLQAGVKFFLGTWMDVPVPRQRQAEIQEIMETLLRKFFSRWAEAPHRAVEHLYEAKRACEFHLLTSLYQIYTAAGEQTLALEGRQPVGALVSGLNPGDDLGPYQLQEEMWADPYARTFLAKHRTHGTLHLVQVLADEWQGMPELAEDLKAALDTLDKAQLGPEHLIPRQHEEVSLQQNGRSRSLQVLVYDWPEAETAAAWQPLDRRRQEASLNFGDLLDLGARASHALATLHAQKLEHGNLDAGNILLSTRGERRVRLKDAWVRRLRPGRCSKPHYTAPEEIKPQGEEDPLKADCWSLGVILYELATGHPPFAGPEEALAKPYPTLRAALGPGVPDALDRVVGECLLPSGRLRPTAEFIYRRFRLAQEVGGTYVGDFAQALADHIQAGHRLFAILHDNPPELEEILKSWDPQRYQVYAAVPEEGLRHLATGQMVFPWHNALQLQQQGLGQLAAAQVGPVNAILMLNEFFSGEALPGVRKVLLMRGTHWWQPDPATLRLLKLMQAHPDHTPVFILVHDHYRDLLAFHEAMDRQPLLVEFPPPTPAALFERIMAHGNVTPEMAIELALHFFPSSMREVNQALRLCLAQHGVIDRRALSLRDELLDQQFRLLGTASFIPVSRLPAWDTVGLPPLAAKRLQEWLTLASFREEQGVPSIRLPQRLLIAGPEGCGKTTLAQALAGRLGFPMVQVSAANCLRGRLGQSEELLRLTLRLVNSLHRVVVLLDDLDKFFEGGAGPQTEVSGLLHRLSGILLHWLDALPPGVVAMVTASEPERLISQWRRRLELEITLPPPDQPGPYREAVYAALLRKFNLVALAQDNNFVARLAAATVPQGGINRIPSPMARRVEAASSLAGHTLLLETGADIEHWLQETILLHGGSAPPEKPGFWEAAIQGARRMNHGQTDA